ncbi:alcohol dehydrogenase [Trichoderma gamsii]|uniref:Alcohol dehydrogenase n=1 Tax=Trichoderma gamsii TaxID=398673 RepID=A0A2P4ZFR2_9HYPO|nr:alcohol dehydrogenase [Trichoderma gamsii]PON23118.1 alcohol dehydrogenase [Trichoderma gamsii]
MHIMKSVIVKARPLRCEIIDVPIPEPGPDEVLIKVIYCASNPRDWKAPDHLIPGVEINQGNEMSGVIEVVGSNVYEFRKGDRVAAAHPMQTENGTYAEYATAPINTCFLLPPNISFEEACTIPFALCTAAIGLYQRLKIPFPTSPESSRVQTPLIVYGGSSSIGAFTLKLAKMGRFEKVIVVCGSGRPYIESFGVVTNFVDYRNGNVVNDLKAALGGQKCFHAVDAINDGNSFRHLSEVLAPEGARMAVYLPRLDYSCIPASISIAITFFGTVHGQATPISNEVFEEDVDFAYVFFRLVGRWIAEGKMSGHPYEVLPRGLQSVEDGLRILKEGNVSAKKLIYRVADTPCL